ncbi:MAG: tyrosine-type recombinase/integrase [Candidatus Rokubacteria bacterium]|nr:tyrosine-type recombinase/integrase [Candidatus Rokubacteria bacterium]
MKTRGLGRVFQPKYRDRTTGEKKVSAVWWVEYYHRGQKHRESSGSTNRADAVRLLKRRLGEIGRGHPIIGRDVDRVTFDDLAAMLVNDYKANERRSLKRIGTASTHLRGVFAGRAVDITPDRITAYVTGRQTEGAANATINRELAALKRMLRLGERAGKVVARPYIAMLEERNTRTGFFEPDEFRAMLRYLPDDVRPVLETAYITGWRVTSEILTRQWAHVDFAAGWLRLEPGETKNCEGRMFPLTPELRAVLERQRERTDALQRSSGRIIPWVFHRTGQPIRHFRRSWLTACKRAGLTVTVQRHGTSVAVATRIPHDFRRTAVRNLERASVPRSAAMKMVGHKTEAIYRRYAIADEALLRESALKLSALHQAQQVMPRR